MDGVNGARTRLTTLRKMGRNAAFVLLGILMSRVCLIDRLAPFGAAYTAALPQNAMAAGVLGVVIGTLIPGGAENRLRYIACALAVAGIRWALAELRRISRHPAFAPCAALAGMLMTGVTVSASVGAVAFYDFAVYSAEALIAAGTTFFFAEGLECAPRIGSGRLTGREQGSLVVTAVVAAIPLCSFTVAGISPGAVVLMVCIMIAATESGSLGGAAAGIAVGTVITAAAGNYAFAGICGAAGLICGVFSMVGRIACAAAFSIACSLASLMAENVNVFFLIEVLIASIIFPLIREGFYKKLTDPFKKEKSPETLPAQDIPERLNMAADALSGISETMDELGEKLGKISEPDIESVCRRAAMEICEGCGIKSYCWEEKLERTKDALDRVCGILKKDGTLTKANAPKSLTENCAKSEALFGRINMLYAEFAARRIAKRRTAQVRSVLADQLGGMGGMLYELADEAAAVEAGDQSAAAVVAKVLSEAGYCASGIRCSSGESGVKISAVISNRERSGVPRKMLGEIIGERLGIELTAPSVSACDEGYVIKMSEIPPFELMCSAAQHSCRGERLCGDCYDIFETESSSYMLLSDGMGSGGRAAVDSAMTCGLLSRLLKAGFTCENALRIVNSALLVKSDDESLSTADCFRLDLFSGQASFIKAGSARSFVRHENEIRQIEPKSLPLGILRGADTSLQTLRLEAGDVVVMVSDGADDGDCDWLTQELLDFEGEPSALAKNLLSLACARRSGCHDDDITVLTAIVSQTQKSA